MSNTKKYKYTCTECTGEGMIQAGATSNRTKCTKCKGSGIYVWRS